MNPSLDFNVESDTDGDSLEVASSYYPDLHLSVSSIIARHGYKCETHTIVSQGYVLNVFRIPGPKKGGIVSNKAVILQHGLFSCSFDWIINGPGKALAYVLADKGYDVWMTNMRGNRYSREHVYLDNNSEQYWNFSFHEIAVYDTPAVIDYVKNIKGPDSHISFISYSIGGAICFIMLSCKPQYNNIIKSAIFLAPTVFMKHAKQRSLAYRTVFCHSHLFARLCSWFGYHAYPSYLFGKMVMTCTKDNGFFYTISKAMLDFTVGLSEKQLWQKNIPRFTNHTFSGTSWKTVVHYTQLQDPINKFTQFDYGITENMKKYGKTLPPEYDLSKVTLPSVVFWSKFDKVSDETDIKTLKSKLINCNADYFEVKEFSHLDFIWGRDSRTVIVDSVLQKLECFDHLDGRKKKY